MKKKTLVHCSEGIKKRVSVLLYKAYMSIALQISVVGGQTFILGTLTSNLGRITVFPDWAFPCLSDTGESKDGASISHCVY
jgi:hypothetical protein